MSEKMFPRFCEEMSEKVYFAKVVAANSPSPIQSAKGRMVGYGEETIKRHNSRSVTLPLFSNIWQHLATFGNIWQHFTTSGNT
jgi:hypothetical protein